MTKIRADQIIIQEVVDDPLMTGAFAQNTLAEDLDTGVFSIITAPDSGNDIVLVGGSNSTTTGSSINLTGGASSATTGFAEYGGSINLTAGAGNGSNYGGNVNITGGYSPAYVGGNVNITSGAAGDGHYSGNVTISTPTENGYTDTATTINLIGGNNNNTGADYSSASGINIQGGNDLDPLYKGFAGDINLRGGNSTVGYAGNIKVTGGTFPDALGGNITAYGGDDIGAGAVKIQGGTSTSTAGGAVNISSGNSTGQVSTAGGGEMRLNAGSTNDPNFGGGDMLLFAGTHSGDNGTAGNMLLFAGSAGGNAGTAGDVVIRGGTASDNTNGVGGNVIIAPGGQATGTNPGGINFYPLSSSGSAASIRIWKFSGSTQQEAQGAYVELKANGLMADTANLSLTLPAVDGANGDVLTTNGSGGLSFTTPTTGVTDHDNLTNNGGVGSHATITAHIADTAIHFSDTGVDGIEYVRKDNAWVVSTGGGVTNPLTADLVTAGFAIKTADIISSTTGAYAAPVFINGGNVTQSGPHTGASGYIKIKAGDTTVNNASGQAAAARVDIIAGNILSSAEGTGNVSGSINITAGDSFGAANLDLANAGAVNITGGIAKNNFTSPNQRGGNVTLTGGVSNGIGIQQTRGGGDVVLTGGESTDSPAGRVQIFGGLSFAESGGDAEIRGGQSTNKQAGNVMVYGGAPSGNVTIGGGTYNGNVQSGGTILIKSGKTSNGIGDTVTIQNDSASAQIILETTPTINVKAADVNVTGNLISHIAINAQIANYTLVLSDDGKIVSMNSASNLTLTIPANATIPMPIGTQILIEREGTGTVTIAITTDTLHSAGGLVTLASQYSTATIIKKSATVWLLAGDLA